MAIVINLLFIIELRFSGYNNLESIVYFVGVDGRLMLGRLRQIWSADKRISNL